MVDEKVRVFDHEMLNHGHDIVDQDEQLKAMTQALTDKIKKKLPEIVKLSIGRGDSTTPYGDLIHAMELIATHMATTLAPITTQAVKDGAKIGRR